MELHSTHLIIVKNGKAVGWQETKVEKKGQIFASGLHVDDGQTAETTAEIIQRLRDPKDKLSLKDLKIDKGRASDS